MRSDPRRVAVEQPRELTGVGRQHRRLRTLEGQEAEERICVDDNWELEPLKQPRDQRERLGAPAQARTDRHDVGSRGLGEDRLDGTVPVERALDRLERERLDRRQTRTRNRDRDIAGIRAQRGNCGEHGRAAHTGCATDNQHPPRRELRITCAAERHPPDKSAHSSRGGSLERGKPNVSDNHLARMEATGGDHKPHLAPVERDRHGGVDRLAHDFPG